MNLRGGLIDRVCLTKLPSVAKESALNFVCLLGLVCDFLDCCLALDILDAMLNVIGCMFKRCAFSPVLVLPQEGWAGQGVNKSENSLPQPPPSRGKG